VLDLVALSGGGGAHLSALIDAVLARPFARSFLAGDTYQQLGIRGQVPKTLGVLPAAAFGRSDKPDNLP
jgi:hypothetical protein